MSDSRLMDSADGKTTPARLFQSRRLIENSEDRRHVLSGSADGEDDWTKPFYFIQAADTQFGMIDSYLKKLENPKWDEEMRLSELLVEKCNRLEPKPAFMVVCGDLTDAMPGSNLRPQQVFDFKRIFSKLDSSIPLVCVCGNHDIGNEPTPESLSAYWDDFGDDYFYFTAKGALFIVLNSQFYEHRANLENYAKGQDDWLGNVLMKCKHYKYSIVFEHIPWFLEKYDEDDDYFNINRSIRLEWLRKFKEAGVNKIMCGHYHRNAGGWYENLELVVTSAVGAQLGNDKSGVRIVELLDSDIVHRYYSIEDIPAKVCLAEQ